MIEFHGERSGEGGPGTVTVVEGGQEKGLLPQRQDISNRSPDGFQWGYRGSGPTQLSIAMLAYVYGDGVDIKTCQEFKNGVIANINSDEWRLTEKTVREWYELNVPLVE